jgi:CheY-like chemotaxis protein
MLTRLILVADDDPMLVTLVRAVLEAAGHSVVSAHDGPSALRRAMERLPDLILLDGQMPGMDGIDVLRALKSDLRTARIPVVMLTARKAEEQVRRAVELGAAGYVTKPFEAEDLPRRIARHLPRGV